MKMIFYFFLLCLFLVVGFSACESNKKETSTEPVVLDDDYVSVVIYDSCEYIISGHGSHRWGSHKGNCVNPIHSKETFDLSFCSH